MVTGSCDGLATGVHEVARTRCGETVEEGYADELP
jgi:hypothetical protein